MAKSKKKSTTSKRVFPPKKKAEPDTWDEVTDEFPENEKEIDVLKETTVTEAKQLSIKKQYPSPKTNRIFSARWNESIVDIAKRENFKPGHLSQLEILCDLYVEYDTLVTFIQKNGYTYVSHGRNGKQYRQWPQVAQRNRCVSEIRQYSKSLGLVLVKDKEVNNDKDLTKEWG